jgi:formylglycine-generating enzyme required for sulfatase activity
MKKIIATLAFVCILAASAFGQTVPDNFVRINGGTFQMGSDNGKDNEKPVHTVTITGFYMGKYEVTQKEWYDVMGTTVRQQRDKADKSWSIYGEGDNYPMYYVRWLEAVEYCNKRSQKEGLTPAYTISGTNVTWNRNANGYRLPTEAEWEYACRAGTVSPFSTGNNITTNQANYNGNNPYNNNAKGEYRQKTTPIGSFQANPWGLYDMHGNVWEWCWDWYGSYSSTAQTDPAGASSGSSRVRRGGGWLGSAGSVRSANRGYYDPDDRNDDIGFRLARNGQ